MGAPHLEAKLGLQVMVLVYGSLPLLLQSFLHLVFRVIRYVDKLFMYIAQEQGPGNNWL